jgi:uncharacterized phiE125 gp8 family phage protein
MEPLDLDEVKEHLHVEGDRENAFLEELVAAARSYVENATERSILTQEWRLTLDRFPTWDDPHGPVILLRRGPVQTVDRVAYIDVDGEEQVIDESEYVLDASQEPARLSLADGSTWPATKHRAAAVNIDATMGYGDEVDHVTDRELLHAIRLVIGHWYRNREGVVTGTISTALQHSLDELLNRFRLVA